MKQALRVLAPAKINLGLRVVGRRPDGYHEIDSLFLPLDLADELFIAAQEADAARVELEVDGDAPADPSNLAVRAAHAFVQAAARPLHVRIRLVKHTPAASGLGGGSSDAAAVLRTLDERWPGRISTSELVALAAGLGADVPFFLDPRPAQVGGIGERIEPVAGVASLALVLANPGQAVSTAEVYAGYDAMELRSAPPPPPLPDLRDPAAVAGPLTRVMHNDLEAAAVRACPAIAPVERALEAAGAVAVGLSGSGATAYGVFPDLAVAARAAESLKLPAPGWTRVASTLESL